MTNTLLPHKESRWLLATGFAVLGAASFGEAVYAFQTAAQSQVIETPFGSFPFDAAVKTVIAIGAGIFGALGLPVSIALWRRGRQRWRNQAKLGFALAGVAVLFSVGNLSGYYAHTRGQANQEIARELPGYAAIEMKADRGERLTRYEQATLMAGQRTASVTREAGDVLKAMLVYGLIVACGVAYTMPREREQPKRGKRAARTETPTTPRQRRPRLVATNSQPELFAA